MIMINMTNATLGQWLSHQIVHVTEYKKNFKKSNHQGWRDKADARCHMPLDLGGASDVPCVHVAVSANVCGAYGESGRTPAPNLTHSPHPTQTLSQIHWIYTWLENGYAYFARGVVRPRLRSPGRGSQPIAQRRWPAPRYCGAAAASGPAPPDRWQALAVKRSSKKGAGSCVDCCVGKSKNPELAQKFLKNKPWGGREQKKPKQYLNWQWNRTWFCNLIGNEKHDKCGQKKLHRSCLVWTSRCASSVLLHRILVQKSNENKQRQRGKKPNHRIFAQNKWSSKCKKAVQNVKQGWWDYSRDKTRWVLNITVLCRWNMHDKSFSSLICNVGRWRVFQWDRQSCCKHEREFGCEKKTTSPRCDNLCMRNHH